MKYSEIAIVLAGFFPHYSYAIDTTIIADNSLGTTIVQTGNTFTIKDGSQVSSNLFHSFAQFDLGPSSTALFKATPALANVFARVTGGESSDIDGKIHVEHSANLYFMNPHGIVFHDNASLDIDGSFYATTADYITSAQGEKFFADSSADSSGTLLIAEPSSFGFISHANGTPEGSLTLNNTSNLSVGTGQTLGLSADHLYINNATISSPDSHISLTAFSDSGEAPVSPAVNTLFDTQSIRTSGQISITNNSSINIDSSSSNQSGSLVIRGGKIILDQSELSATKFVFGDVDAGKIDIQGATVEIKNGSLIDVAALGFANSGEITINAADSITLAGTKTTGSSLTPSSIIARTSKFVDGGSRGKIEMASPSVYILDSAKIETIANGKGDSGNINISTDSLIVQGNNTRSSNILASTLSSGTGGTITIKGFQKDNASLVSLSHAQINSRTQFSGDGGNIAISADQLLLQQESQVSAATLFTGSGGGDGGDMTIQAKTLSLSGNSRLTAESTGTGAAGTISIKTENLLMDASDIALASTLSDGGDITIEGNSPAKLVSLDNGSAITASVGGGASTTGGNISIDSDFLVLSNSQITSQAFLGNGGNIQITSQGLFSGSQSIISASSELGVDGVVDIDSVVEIIETALGLPDAYASAIKLNQEPCTLRSGTHTISSFVISEKQGMPASPDTMMSADFSDQYSLRSALSNDRAQALASQYAEPVTCRFSAG